MSDGSHAPGPGAHDGAHARDPSTGGAPSTGAEPLLEVRDLVKSFPVRAGFLRRRVGEIQAVAGVSFDVFPGETLGLVGESGSGKSTTGRSLLLLERPTAGRVRFRGRELDDLEGRELRGVRAEMQMIFQDPYASLNPRHTVGRIVREPLDVHAIGTAPERKTRVLELLERVGLEPDHARRFPHEFSGGQRQRIGIARALATAPRLIVADEPISALDVSIQAQIVNLLRDLQEELGIAYLFIAHDLAMVRHISHRVAVMALGRIVEIGPRDAVFRRPLHPYTRTLLAAVPRLSAGAGAPDGADAPRGELPDPAHPPPGCRYHTRCPFATERCRVEVPELRPLGAGHRVACHHAEDLEAGAG
ncbi:MAG TPA: oligopeptide/dipeptide ABC transporter ATP-binding protein [Longimicrobiales bacterium]|nr:oligopeptide/dipeptide ABC transporter ATP-binding protein [Longimicrobiales bacterium]